MQPVLKNVSRFFNEKDMPLGNSLVVQGSGLSTFTATAWGSIPGQRTKILQASQYSKNKQTNKPVHIYWMVAAKRHASNLPTSSDRSAQSLSSQHYSQWSGRRNTPVASNKQMDKNWCGHTRSVIPAFKERKVWHMTQHGCTMRYDTVKPASHNRTNTV